MNVCWSMRLACAAALAAIAMMLTAPRVSAQDAQRGAEEEMPSLQDSCQGYVQDFYNWYVAGLNSDTFLEKRDATWVRAVKIHKSEFSAELAEAIEKDGKAQAKHTGEIVGLDFDPFLGAQDRDDRYVTGFVKVNGNACRVEMFGYANDEKREDSNVTAELNWDGKRWTLVNFRYPSKGKGNDEGEDLLSVLKAQRKRK